MVDFATELANELNSVNFLSLTPVMAENATAASVGGIQCGKANMLADVYSTSTNCQYSVKSYRDDMVQMYMNGLIKEDRKVSDFIIERRIGAVYNPNGDPLDVYIEIINDIKQNELLSLNYYNVQNTNSVLLGYSEDDEYFYFRLSEFDYDYPVPDSAIIKEFTPASRDYMKHKGNISSIVGYVNNELRYEWIHPNRSSYTRCLKKKYNFKDAETFHFKIRKKKYVRPSNSELLGMVLL